MQLLWHPKCGILYTSWCVLDSENLFWIMIPIVWPTSTHLSSIHLFVAVVIQREWTISSSWTKVKPPDRGFFFLNLKARRRADESRCTKRCPSIPLCSFGYHHNQRLYTLLCTTLVNIFKAVSFLVLILQTSADPKVWWWNPVIPTNWEECGEAVENDWQPSPLKGLLLCWWSSHPQILWHSLVSTYSWGFLGQQQQPREAEGCNVLHVGKNPTMMVYSSVKQWLLQLRVKQRLT